MSVSVSMECSCSCWWDRNDRNINININMNINMNISMKMKMYIDIDCEPPLIIRQQLSPCAYSYIPMGTTPPTSYWQGGNEWGLDGDGVREGFPGVEYMGNHDSSVVNSAGSQLSFFMTFFFSCSDLWLQSWPTISNNRLHSMFCNWNGRLFKGCCALAVLNLQEYGKANTRLIAFANQFAHYQLNSVIAKWIQTTNLWSNFSIQILFF